MNHPNKRPFSGVLLRVDEISDVAPSCLTTDDNGEKRYASRIYISKEVARLSLHDLIGCPVNWGPTFAGHAFDRIGGVITDACIIRRDVLIEGHLFEHNSPKNVGLLDRGDLGMSFEATQCHVIPRVDEVWEITNLTFTGIAVVKALKAAYRTTSFKLH